MNCLVANNVNYLAGTAWLSSARVVECSIYLLNGRNLRCSLSNTFFVKDTVITFR